MLTVVNLIYGAVELVIIFCVSKAANANRWEAVVVYAMAFILIVNIHNLVGRSTLK